MTPTAPYRFHNVADLRDYVCKLPLQKYILVSLTSSQIILEEYAFHRLCQVADDTDAAITYAYYRHIQSDGKLVDHPVIDYQPGSLRDDFDFGPVVLLNIADILSASEDFDDTESNYLDGGWYALRLRMTIGKTIAMVPEFLSNVERTDYRNSGQKQHDYVDPSRRDYQIEMEEVLVNHLYELNALTTDHPIHPAINQGEFDVEASVIIPVRNRHLTIADAVRSALGQQTDFKFNVIVVDNASTDGTSEVLSRFTDPRLKVITLDGSENLGIGGCWNKALLSKDCGRFAVQLDSDDVYSSNDTLSRIVRKFHDGQYAMVIGSYTLTDFNLNVIPPGLIDHKEWTDRNGADNALRINGFGAPRAYYTPIARDFLFPNVSYGEDYAMCLRISRDYAVGRIFDSLYNCRRWDGNSDARLSIEKVNEHNYYKDFLRSLELMARFQKSASGFDGELN